MMTHDEASELLAVFALDAVDSDEQRLIEEHLAGCPRCRAELDAHREVAAALGNSVEPLPEGLWSSISSRLPARHDEEPPPIPRLVWDRSSDRDGASSEVGSTSARSARRRLTVVGAIAAAAAVVAVILGVNLASTNNQVANLKVAVGAGTVTAVDAALHTPGHRVVTLEGAGSRPLAEFVTVPNGQGYLVKSELPPLSSSHTYQLWGVIGGRAISLGLMGSAPKQVTFTLAGPRRPSVLRITVEPAGGSTVPGAMVATGTV
jgi:hypothetical protein